MSMSEFEHAAVRLAPELDDADRRVAVAAACRGSGNPAVLAWLAEGLGLAPGVRVVDIGGGLGGPCAWLHDRYGVDAVTLDPVRPSSRAAWRVFGVPAMTADGATIPVRDHAFDVALALGVLSVVDSMTAVLREAARVARRLGLIVYTSTGPQAVRCGGSCFPSRRQLQQALEVTGWDPQAGPTTPSLPPPPSWQTDDPPDQDDEEVAVALALADGRIEPLVAVCERRRPPCGSSDSPSPTGGSSSSGRGSR